MSTARLESAIRDRMLSHCPAMAGQRMNARSASSSGGQRLGRSPSRSITQPVSRRSSNGVWVMNDARWKRMVAAITVVESAMLECVRCDRNEIRAMKPIASASLSRIWVWRRASRSERTSASPAMTPIEPRTISQPVPARNPAMTGNGYEPNEAAEPEVAHEIEGNAGKHARHADRRNNCHQDFMFAGAGRERFGHRRCDDGQRSERHFLRSADHSRHARVAARSPPPRPRWRTARCRCLPAGEHRADR